MKHLWNLGFALIFSAMVVGCGGNGDDSQGGKENGKGETITQKGSDTMVLLAQKWAEEFGKKHSNVQVAVTGGGSGTGISALINGTTQIANASRPMKEEERAQMRQKNGYDPVEIPVAKDGISIYVHSDNPVEQLTIEQLRDIYEGKIANWKEIGGPDASIILYGRENNSGTYDFFKEHVLDKGDFATHTQTMAGTAGVVNAVANDKNGIGYGGAAYSKGIKVLKLAGADGEALLPTLENVTSGKYLLARDLYFYLASEPTGVIKEYIDWILSDEGQKLTRVMEYFPIRPVGEDEVAGGEAGTDAKTDDTAATVN